MSLAPPPTDPTGSAYWIDLAHALVPEATYSEAITIGHRCAESAQRGTFMNVEHGASLVLGRRCRCGYCLGGKPLPTIPTE